MTGAGVAEIAMATERNRLHPRQDSIMQCAAG
jgi:hypothetical protein